MVVSSVALNGASIKQAIESHDGRTLASFYADKAVTKVVDQNNPPAKPREIKGRAAIGAFWDDVCSRTMTHRVDVTVAEGDRLVYTQSCTYPDGTQVFGISLLELADGLIVKQTMVQAWDE
jgi:ketosteroid isomerase-like protein